MNPIRAYRRWRRRQQGKCVVEIEHPRMRIKGQTFEFIADLDLPKSFGYVGFLGIPYAAPPEGRLRFQPPQPYIPKGSRSKPELRKAYKQYQCLQPNRSYVCGIDEDAGEGCENCLYLNVYLPKKPEEFSKLLPVLVYIHGGEFQYGNNSTQEIKPDFIIRHDVVFVTINYRLGLFGFLNMRTEDCQGNAGLKDQVEALKWIQRNIQKFGGDPNNVTISGHEAGATCVNLHLISPLSKGLFHKAIVQAGGIYSPWGLKEKQQIDAQQRHCMKYYFPKQNLVREAIVKVLKNGIPQVLCNEFDYLSRKYKERKPLSLMLFMGPSEEYRAEGAFIPPCESIESLMKQAEPVPIIAGISNQEGYKYFYDRLGYWTEEEYMRMVFEDDEFMEFLEQNLRWSSESALNRKDELRRIYFGDWDILQLKNFQTIQDNLATFITDIWFHRFYDNFKIGTNASSRILYVYQFDHFAADREDRNEVEREENEKIRRITLRAPGHGDDMYYMYDPLSIPRFSECRRVSKKYRAETRKVVENMCSLWSSFCSDGIPRSLQKPNFNWLPHTEEQPHYLSINEPLEMISDRLRGSSWIKLREILQSEITLPSPMPSPVAKRRQRNKYLAFFAFRRFSERFRYSQLRDST